MKQNEMNGFFRLLGRPKKAENEQNEMNGFFRFLTEEGNVYKF